MSTPITSALILAMFAVAALADDSAVPQGTLCVPPPFCEGSPLGMFDRLYCSIGQTPLQFGSPRFNALAVARLEFLLNRNIVGQDHVIPLIVRDVKRKLQHPEELLLMHFAGDNGVGKTSAAHLISAALSLRCHTMNAGPYCTMGDALLSLSGTNYHGLGTEAFRSVFVQSVIAHAKRYPFGVVVLNDLSSMALEHIHVILPLLGRNHYFAEDPSVDLRKLTVIVTTDFGQQGRTRGKNLREVQHMIEEEVRVGFGSLAGSMLKTYPFLPISLGASKGIIRLNLNDWACASKVASMTVEADVVDKLFDSFAEHVAFQNGRAVSQHMDSAIGDMESSLMEDLLQRTVAMRNITVAMAPNGKDLRVFFTPAEQKDSPRGTPDL